MITSKSKLVNGFIIGTFVSLYLLVSVISTIHVIDFFKLSNPEWLAISLAIGFEVGAAASLAALITLDKMNKTLVWALFITITLMQMQGNMYYAFINLKEYNGWVELFNLIEWEPLAQKRLLSAVSGAILPLVALGFIKSLVDYIKPEKETDEISVNDLDVISEEINHPKKKLSREERGELLAEMMQNDEELGLYNEWDTTLMDGLENEPFEVDVISTDEKEPEIKTVYVEKPVEVIKEVIKEVPVEVIKEVPVTGIIDTVNQSTATIDDKKRKGPLYAYRTNRSPEDDKNLTQSTD